MPKLTLVLDRKTVEVYDLDLPLIRIGRTPGVEIVIDNVSVSRRQAELARDGARWVVRDSGSSNGTFVNGERLAADRPLVAGAEISFGKFSLFFESDLKVVEPARPEAAAAAAARPAPRGDSTMYLRPDEVESIQKSAAQKRQAHVLWESGGRRGTQYLDQQQAVLIGTSELCDVRVPSGPKHHVLVIRAAQGFEARNLSWWRRMRVKGVVTARTRLANGDVVEIGGLKLTFMDELR
jgi:hypothetical protein